jgi:ribonuclease Z
LVGGRGVRTVVNTFPVAGAGGGAPTVQDDCVTLTPVVVRPRRRNDSSSTDKTGPLGVGEAKTASLRESIGAPPAKRAKLVLDAKTSFSAYAVDAADAESVCYHGRLADMPGKFDASKADALGVPRGAVRGKLVRGEDVLLEDGRLIRSSDVVAEKRRGFSFVVVDVPTLAHLEDIADPDSDAHKRFDEVCGVHQSPDERSPLAVVVHLAPAAVATSAAYTRWMETCGAFSTNTSDATKKTAFDQPRHLMVHSEATGSACVFRSAAAVNARLHAVDASVFPEPRNAASANADAQARALADAAAREAETSKSPLTHPGCNLSRFTLVPLDAAGLDTSPVPRALVARKVREDLDVNSAVARFLPREPSETPLDTEKEQKKETGDVPACLRALKPGDVELVFLGTGSSMPAKYRNVSGLFLDSKSKGGVLIDCGEGSFGQLCRLYGPDAAREKVRNLRCAWISHIHADHHVGLPTILIERRKAILNEKGNASGSVPPLLVVGPAPLRRFLNAFSQVEPLDFEFVDCRNATNEKWDSHMSSRRNDDETNARVGDAETFPLDPRLVSAATRLGLRRIVSVPVVHCAQSFALVLEAEPPDGADGAEPGWKAVYSGDTRPCAALTSAARDATVLIHEATFEDELFEDAVKKKHSTTSEAIATGVDANCYRVILTHFSQRYPKAPVFDGHIGGDDKSENEPSDADDTTRMKKKNVSDRVGVAFDLMRVDFTALPRLPTLMPAIRALFPDPVEDAAPAEDAAAE